MSINEIDNNGKSKIISHKTGVLGSANHGISDKADQSAPSHNKRPVVDLGHASHSTNHTAKKVLKDQGTGGRGARGSY